MDLMRGFMNQTTTLALSVLLVIQGVAGPPTTPSGSSTAALPRPLQTTDLAPRAQFDPRVRHYIAPKRIVWQSHEDGAVVESPDNLLQPDNGQITLDNRSACTLRHNGKAPGLLLDFGRELSGGLQIAVADLKPSSKDSKTVRLRVRFGESVSEAMSEHVLGVTVLEPGCAAVRIAPQLGDLQWAEGTFPTPKGVIKLLHEKGADGKVVSKIDAPEGVRIER